MNDSNPVHRRALATPALAAFATILSMASRPAAAQYLAIKHLAIADGNGPRSALVQDAQGALYGTAMSGGEHGLGSVFKIDPDGDNFVVLHSFNTTDGRQPMAGLILGQGFLYGTTSDGGSHSAGVVFKIGTDGNNFSVIHEFDPDSDGGGPFGSLVQGPDTILYGVAHDDGPNGFGTVFSLNVSGTTFTVIHTFGSTPTDGADPYAGLLFGSDGFLYGTTEKGHNGSGLGTVFRMDTAGSTYLNLHTFTGGLDGQDPKAPLLEVPDGFIYGTTVFGGTSSGGTAFKVRTDGTSYSVIHAFSTSDGRSPEAALARVEGGLLYGTAPVAGASSGGTIFRMTTSGAMFGVAHDFASASGAAPRGAVLQGLDKALYGTASDGGSHSVGVVYRLDVPSVASITPSSGISSGGTAVTIIGTGFQSNAVVTIGGIPATSVEIVDATHITAVTPALPAGTLNDVAIVNPDNSIGFLQYGWLSDFLDVPQSYLYHASVEKIVRAFITTGCGAGNFCPSDPVTRDAMAKFLLVAKRGPAFFPPPAIGTVFCDVSTGTLLAKWIEELKLEGITSGAETGACGKQNYHPADPVTRDAMAKFLLIAKKGPGFSPPAATGTVFCDVTDSTFLAKWIEELKAESITSGCNAGACGKPDYCPTGLVSRGEMAKFLRIAFSL